MQYAQVLILPNDTNEMLLFNINRNACANPRSESERERDTHLRFMPTISVAEISKINKYQNISNDPGIMTPKYIIKWKNSGGVKIQNKFKANGFLSTHLSFINLVAV